MLLPGQVRGGRGGLPVPPTGRSRRGPAQQLRSVPRPLSAPRHPLPRVLQDLTMGLAAPCSLCPDGGWFGRWWGPVAPALQPPRSPPTPGCRHDTHEAQELSGSECLGTSGGGLLWLPILPLLGGARTHLRLMPGSPLMSAAHLWGGTTWGEAWPQSPPVPLTCPVTSVCCLHPGALAPCPHVLGPGAPGSSWEPRRWEIPREAPRLCVLF